MARRPFFSGNYGSALGSFDTAAKLIAQAGQTQGQAMANIGKQVGGMIEQYGLNKQKKEELENKIRNRIRLDPSLAQRLTMTGDEDFDKKNFSDMEKLSKGELGLKGLRGLDSAMATVKEIDLQKQQEEDRNIKTKMSLALLNEQEDKNELKDRLENQRQASIKLVQQEAQGLLNRLLSLSGPERQEAFDSLNPLQRKKIREYQLIKQGDIDPADYMLSAEDVLNMEVNMLELEKLQGEIKDKDTERTDKEEDKTRKEREYAGLEVELSSIDQALNEGLITLDTLNPNQRYILSQRDKILQRLPLDERPDAVEVLAEDKKREAEVAGFVDQQKLRDLGYNVSPRGVFDPTEEGLFRVGTKAESAEPPVASPVTTPPQVFNPVEAKAFRGQFGPQIVDQLDRAYSYFTGKTLPTTDQEEVKRQKQNLATIGNAITPVLLAELGGRVTNLMIERVESNIPLATDNVTVGRQKIGQLVNLAKSQLSRANTYIETLKKGTEAYAEALGVKRFLEANIPALERSIGSLDRAYDLKIDDPFLSVDQNVNDSNRTNIDPNRMSNKDLFNIVNQN